MRSKAAALGDQMAVPAMGAGDPVLVAQMNHDAASHRLLSDVEVQSTRNLAVLHELAGGFLEQPDAHHAAVQVQKRLV